MAVEWTAHRFSGGVLALDVANTIVHRDRPEKRFDRFAEAFEIGRFASAASSQRAEELNGRALEVENCEGAHGAVVGLREATDVLFRDAVGSATLRPLLLTPFLKSVAQALEADEQCTARGREGRTLRFETALGFSALSLLAPERHRRIRICPNCSWLFLDRSRNRSRTWCDMAVCGNRQKARRQYRRKREDIDG